jgi:hypothetical protein
MEGVKWLRKVLCNISRMSKFLVPRQKNVGMNPTGPGTKNDCADEDHQNFPVRPTASSGKYPNRKKKLIEKPECRWVCNIIMCLEWLVYECIYWILNFRTSPMATFINTCAVNLQLLKIGTRIALPEVSVNSHKFSLSARNSRMPISS